ncbi:MAG: hypothetical protein H6Q26_144 [Bacteroidetes bacterium]|nr:hypothetical protein [Bacteroidota bacterium]
MSIVNVRLQPLQCIPQQSLAPSSPPSPDPKDRYYVFAPLINAQLLTSPENTILVRVTLLIDTAVQASDVIYSPGHAEITGNIMSCRFQFTPPPETSPNETVNLYYSEFTFMQNSDNPIDTVQVYLTNTDPQTSRGTETTVQN